MLVSNISSVLKQIQDNVNLQMHSNFNCLELSSKIKIKQWLHNNWINDSNIML